MLQIRKLAIEGCLFFSNELPSDADFGLVITKFID